MCCYTLKVPALASYYKSRRIPMCELYELYVEDKFDWNEQCEGGDCYKILQNHRDKFVNYKTTWRQVPYNTHTHTHTPRQVRELQDNVA